MDWACMLSCLCSVGLSRAISSCCMTSNRIQSTGPPRCCSRISPCASTAGILFVRTMNSVTLSAMHGAQGTVKLSMSCLHRLCGVSLKHLVPQVNILDAVRWLVRDTQPQDSLVFAFSGHGCLDVSDEQERDGILSSDYEQV